MQEIMILSMEQHKSAPYSSIEELYEKGLKKGDIITADMTISWIREGESYKVGEPTSLYSVRLHRINDQKEIINSSLSQGIGSKIWSDKFIKG